MVKLTWFTLPDGSVGFKGTLGGYPRQMVGKSKADLLKIARRMARGEA